MGSAAKEGSLFGEFCGGLPARGEQPSGQFLRARRTTAVLLSSY